MAKDSKDGKKTLEIWKKIWNVKRLQTDVSDGRCSPETAFFFQGSKLKIRGPISSFRGHHREAVDQWI